VFKELSKAGGRMMLMENPAGSMRLWLQWLQGGGMARGIF
jgi:hypothetical protein